MKRKLLILLISIASFSCSKNKDEAAKPPVNNCGVIQSVKATAPTQGTTWYLDYTLKVKWSDNTTTEETKRVYDSTTYQVGGEYCK